MLKQYIKRLILKEWLPVIAVFAIVSLALTLTYGSIIDFYPDNYYYQSKSIFDFVYLSIPMSIFAVVLPFFVYSYRFKIQSCDTYYQLPFAPKKLKTTRLLTGIITILAIYTAVFIILFAIVTIKYYSSPEIKDIYTTYFDWTIDEYVSGMLSVHRVDFNPFMLFVTYLIGIITIAGLYFETCFFISLTNTIMSAVVMNIMAQIFFTLILIGLSLLVTRGWSFNYVSFMLLSPSLVGANGMVQTFSYSFVIQPQLYEYIYGQPIYIVLIFYAINALVFAGFGCYVLLEKDPSGENAGRPATRNAKLDYIIYATMFIEMVMVIVPNSSGYLWYIGFAASTVYFGYRYLITSLFFQTPRLEKGHYLIMAAGAIIMAIGIFI